MDHENTKTRSRRNLVSAAVVACGVFATLAAIGASTHYKRGGPTTPATVDPAYTPSSLHDVYVGVGQLASGANKYRPVNGTANTWSCSLGVQLPLDAGDYYLHGIAGVLTGGTASQIDDAWVGVFKFTTPTWTLLAGKQITAAEYDFDWSGTTARYYDATLASDIAFTVTAGDVLRAGLIMHRKSGASGNNPTDYCMDFIESDDDANQLSIWYLRSVTVAYTNNWVLYWNLTDAAGTRTVSLYRDVGKAAGNLVAQGSRSGNGTLTLTEQNGSGISGYLYVAYTGDDTEAENTLTVEHPDSACPWVSSSSAALAYGASGTAFTVTAANAGPPPVGYVKLKTAKRTAYTVATPSVTGWYSLPVYPDKAWITKLGSVDMAGGPGYGDSLTANFYASATTSGIRSSKAAVIYDGSAVTPTMSLAGTAHNLTPGEQIDNHDLALVVRDDLSTTQIDLVWQDIYRGRGPLDNYDVSGLTWTEATNTLSKAGAFADFVLASWSAATFISGTGVTVGTADVIASRTSDDAVVMTTDSLADNLAADVRAVFFSQGQDFATYSWAGKQTAGPRDSGGSVDGLPNSAVAANRVTATAPYWVEFSASGTPTIATLEVGTEPLVIVGDSQCGSTQSPNLLANATYGLGYEFGVQEQSRITWVNAIAGSRIGTRLKEYHTEGSSRFANPTAGSGDVCELPGLVVMAGMGANDFAYDLTTDLAIERNREMASFAGGLARIIKYATANGSTVFVIGMPPRSWADYYSTDYDDLSASIVRCNTQSKAICEACRVFFYDPYELVFPMRHVYLNSIQLSGAVWGKAGKTLTLAGGFAAYSWTDGDLATCYVGTGSSARFGWGYVASRTNDNEIVMASDVFSTDGDTLSGGSVQMIAQPHYNATGAAVVSAAAVTAFLAQ